MPARVAERTLPLFRAKSRSEVITISRETIITNIQASISCICTNAANAATYGDNPGSFTVGQTNAGGAQINRAIMVLDSSGIPASPSMLSASLFLNIAANNTAPLTLCLVLHGAVNQPVVASNYGDLLGQTAILGSALIPANFSGWLEVPLTALGLAAINVGTSTTFALRSLDDINAVAPTGDALAGIAYAAGNAYWAIRFNL